MKSDQYSNAITSDDERFFIIATQAITKMDSELQESNQQFAIEINRDRVMKAWEFCDIYGCDDDIFIDDDQLVYISDTRNGTAWVVDTVKHIHEDF